MRAKKGGKSVHNRKGWKIVGERTVKDPAQARPHNVDVIDSEVLFPTVFVVEHVLRSSALDRICVRILCWTSVNDDVGRGSTVDLTTTRSIEAVRGRDGAVGNGHGLERVRVLRVGHEDRLDELLVLDGSGVLGDANHRLRRAGD
jgi:hypothetical protein